MAIAMNGGSGNGRRRWQQQDHDRQWRRQCNGWQDGGAIAMVMGNGGEKATRWKMAMAVAQLK